jgi:hypothetical protein
MPFPPLPCQIAGDAAKQATSGVLHNQHLCDFDMTAAPGRAELCYYFCFERLSLPRGRAFGTEGSNRA